MTWKARLWLFYVGAVVLPLVALTYLATSVVQKRVERAESAARNQTLEVFSRALDAEAVRARQSLDRLARYLERPAAGQFVETSLSGSADVVPWSHILSLLTLHPMPERLRLVDPAFPRAVSFVELDGKTVANATQGADSMSLVTAIPNAPTEEEIRSWVAIAGAEKDAWVRYLPEGKLEMGVRFVSTPPQPPDRRSPRARRLEPALAPPPAPRFIVADFHWSDFLLASIPRDGRAEYFVAEPTSGAVLGRAAGDAASTVSIPTSGTLAALEAPSMDLRSTMVPNLGVAAAVRSPLDPTLAQRAAILWACVAAFLVMIAVGVTTHARDLTQGLKEIAAGVSAYAAGRFTHRVPLWTRDEVGRVGQSMNVMAGQLDRTQRAVSVAARQDVMRKLRRRIGREVTEVSSAMTHLGKQLQTETVPRALLRGAGEVTLRLAERVRAIETDIPEVLSESFWPTDLPAENVDLAVTLDEAIAASRALARSNVDVRRVVPPGTPPLRLPRAPLCAIFRSIFDNALRAMPKGGTLKIEVSVHSKFVMVVVIDSGMGMAAEFVNNELFQAFSSGWPTEDGLGLSLYRARQFLQAIGGEIEAASHEGVGTRVMVRLPLPPASPTDRRSQPSAAQAISTLGNPPSLAQN
jgi:signal transduction histidine kinase